LISFGSNLGQRELLVADAARIIASSSLVHNLRASRLYETPPIGGPDGQPPFLNAVAAVDTAASAREILDLLQQTEQRLGRKRNLRWDSRSIDLDVVLHGELVGGSHGMIVPHPRYTARQFVLQPACDVAEHFRDPRFGWTLQQLSDHLRHGVPSMSLVGGDQRIRRELLLRLTARPACPASSVITPLFEQPLLSGERSQQIEANLSTPWVSAFLPTLPALNSQATRSKNVPRLVARIQQTTSATRWPAPHQLWPGGWDWPEYRLEIDDLDWAAGEIVSALTSMRCPLTALTTDGKWCE
jgi:2-amino-4-hydroxy-6-hydroxymethyldihydropteridine diphosphokinase